MKSLYLDCFSGISGDMTVGVLRDLGVGEEVFVEAIAALGLGEELHLHFGREERQMISGTRCHVHAHAHTHHLPHSHEHGHEHVHGRTYREIGDILRESRLQGEVKGRALAVFRRIAIAEAKIHGVPVEDVGFHEVGAGDSIADIVAACAGFHALGVECIEASSLVEGTGWISCAHGNFPLPAPATLEILAGIPLRQVDDPHEWITPTGAALIAEFATRFGTMRATKIARIGYGIGSRDTVGRPNVLRGVLGEVDDVSLGHDDVISQIETNLDDMTPELMAAAMDVILQRGALDVFLIPVQMKKGRMGAVMTVLCEVGQSSEFARLILEHTSAFGVRIHERRRLKLQRRFVQVETPYGPVQVKLGFLGERLVQSAPEYESCHAAASVAQVPVREVYLAAQCAFAQRPSDTKRPEDYGKEERTAVAAFLP